MQGFYKKNDFFHSRDPSKNIFNFFQKSIDKKNLLWYNNIRRERVKRE